MEQRDRELFDGCTALLCALIVSAVYRVPVSQRLSVYVGAGQRGRRCRGDAGNQCWLAFDMCALCEAEARLTSVRTRRRGGSGEAGVRAAACCAALVRSVCCNEAERTARCTELRATAAGSSALCMEEDTAAVVAAAAPPPTLVRHVVDSASMALRVCLAAVWLCVLPSLYRCVCPSVHAVLCCPMLPLCVVLCVGCVVLLLPALLVLAVLACSTALVPPCHSCGLVSTIHPSAAISGAAAAAASTDCRIRALITL